MSLLFDSNFMMASANADSFLKVSMGTKSASTGSGEKRYRSRSRYGTVIEKLQAGDYFGHRALCQRDEAGLFSVFVDEPLELLGIRAEIFTEMFLQQFQEEFRSKAEFLSRVRFFSGWSPHLIRQLVFTLREKKYHPGECIFRQDVPTHCLYLVKSGSIKLSTHCSRKPPDEVMEKIEPERDFLGEILEEGKPSPPKEPQISSISKVSLLNGNVVSRVSLTAGVSQLIKESRSTLSLPSLAHRRKSSLPLAAHLDIAKNKAKQNESRKKQKQSKMPVHLLGFKLREPRPDSNIEICNLGPGELLGDIEALCELKHHLFNAVCMTTTVVYEVNLFHIEQLLHKKAPRTLYCILRHIMQKVESWHSRHKYVQFFEPIGVLLGQVDKKLTKEGANKPIRHQHNYDAGTLALMATRSLGKPIPSANSKARARTLPDNSGELNSRPFSSLYGGGKCSSQTGTNRRRQSIPAYLFLNGTLSPPSREPKQVVVINSNSAMHCLRQSNTALPRLVKTKKFSFDSPPPRSYHSKPNLMSSAKFVIPPPSPYPCQENKSLFNHSFEQQLKEDNPEGDHNNGIEEITLTSGDSPPPIHGERQRCSSADVHQVCAKPTLSIRPKTADPIFKKTPPSTPILPNMGRDEVEDIPRQNCRLSTVVPVQGNPPEVPATPIVMIPMATTSEVDVMEKACDVVTRSATEEEMDPREMEGASSQQESQASAGEAVLHETPTNAHDNGLSSNNGLQKQVNPELPCPKSQAIPEPETATVVGKEGVDIRPGITSSVDAAECKPQDSKINIEASKLDDLETTLPKEYARLQHNRSTMMKPSNPAACIAADAEMSGEEICTCDCAITASAVRRDEKLNHDMLISLAYRSLPVSYYAAHVGYQTR